MQRKKTLILKTIMTMVAIAAAVLAVFILPPWEMHSEAGFCYGEDCSDVTFYDMNGNEVSVSSYSEDGVFLVFGREGCGYCRSTVAFLANEIKAGTNIKVIFLKIDNTGTAETWNEYRAQYEKYGIVFSNYSPNWNNQLHWTFERYANYNGQYTPLVVALDKNRKFVGCHDAYDETKLRNEIAAVTEDKLVEATDISISPGYTIIEVGESVQYTATLQPANATKGEWYTDDSGFISVDENGVVTGLSEGIAYVGYKTANRSSYCTVIVRPGPVKVTFKQEGGQMLYCENGVHIKDKYGFVDYNGSKFLVANGAVVTSKNGVAQDPDDKDIWYFCANGQVVTSKSGLVQYPAKTDNWFIVEKGKLDTTYSGFVDYNGGKFFVARGKLVRKDGLVQDPNNVSDWYFLAGGQVQKNKTGIAIYDGAGFYVVNGKLNSYYTGSVVDNGVTYNVANGRVV